METSLTIDYDKQWLNCVSAIGPKGSIPFWERSLHFFVFFSILNCQGEQQQ